MSSNRQLADGPNLDITIATGSEHHDSSTSSHDIDRSSLDEDRDDENDALLTTQGDTAVSGKAGFKANISGMTRLGMLRAYWLGIIVCIGGFLCKFMTSAARHPLY
jgi:hypothetical protein